MANELWGKARSYLESSLALAPTADAYALYGRLLTELGEDDARVARVPLGPAAREPGGGRAAAAVTRPRAACARGGADGALALASALRLRAARVEPLDQRIPLLPIRPSEVRRQLMHAEAALVGTVVVLRFAERARRRAP